MGTLFLNEQNLLAIVEHLTVRASWAIAAATIGASEALMYQWLDKSRKAEAVRDESSPFFLTWRGEASWWHRHCARARKDNLLSLSALVADQLKFGQEEICYDNSTGRPLPELDPEFLGVSDAEMLDRLLDPVRDRWIWETDSEGSRTHPRWQRRKVEMPASLKAVVLRGLLPRTFGEKAEINHNVSGAVTHIIEPARFVPRAERLAIEAREKGEVVDASFTEVVPERPDIAALRAAWNERQANLANRVTQPRSPVRKGDGTLVGAKAPNDADDAKPVERPQIPLNQHPRSYTQPTPQPPEPRPPSGYPSHSDPTRPGARANRILK